MLGSSIRFAAIPLIAIGLLLQGCGEKKASEAGGKDTQVAAKVNGDEITVSQINTVVQRLGKVPEDKVKAVSNQALATLINQQLLIQKAVSEKLDRNPNVMQAIEAAKNEILAQSYIQTKTQGVAKPTDAEITEFYNKHPELFSERRAYRLQEINIQNAADKADAIRARLTASKDLEEFAKWLKAENYKFGAGQTERAAEQLPPALATQLLNVKPGQAILANNNGTLVVVMVVAVAPQPISAEQAKPTIEKILMAQKQREIADNEIKTLRTAAKIEYMGSFKDAGKQAEKPAEQAAPAAQPAPPTAPAQPAEQQAPAKPDAAAIKKGLSGL